MRQAIEQLLGIVETMVADGDLHDLEIEFLKVWLAENSDVARVWPGHAVSRAIETVLADGHVSEDERAYLMTTLKQLAAGDFVWNDTDGAADFALPMDNAIEITLRDSLVCLAGEFLHGTRAACERLLERAGGWPAAAVSRNVRYLVIGSKVPPNWTETPLAQTIKDALALQQAGHAIAIISERRWLECVAGRAMP
ncbi:BRCT domain-containing protein [Variovorax sp. J22P240]|uniref:BRCT domain-containing protein n=1 Tax=unclassified Variovorax TaxID=663243 RepID=UPI002578E474|nr:MULTISPECIES: BRCT domain-containing protein [unclassified Variovorax]MDL9997529.1 BRCT domain-containing protein [Variovorax sp. J22P240]MDM0051565.1 BRCT domain-containing protein [Variovorax sp. J22R115]